MRHSYFRAGLILAAVTLLGGASAVAAGPAALAAPHAAGTALTGRAELAPAGAADTAGMLNAVAAVSSRDLWAVGCSGSCNGPDSLILHSNGKTWSKVSSPNPGGWNNVLFGVSAVTADDAWAVGDTSATSPGGVQSLVMHWNGTARTGPPRIPSSTPWPASARSRPGMPSRSAGSKPPVPPRTTF